MTSLTLMNIGVGLLGVAVLLHGGISFFSTGYSKAGYIALVSVCCTSIVCMLSALTWVQFFHP
jgi:hypothetical protein